MLMVLGIRPYSIAIEFIVDLIQFPEEGSLESDEGRMADQIDVVVFVVFCKFIGGGLGVDAGHDSRSNDWDVEFA
jgi:hypothetical protein